LEIFMNETEALVGQIIGSCENEVQPGMARDAQDRREHAAHQFGEAIRRFASGTHEPNLLAFACTPSEGVHDLQARLSGLVDGVVQTNLRMAQELFLAKSPRDYAELQQRFLIEYLDAFQQGVAALLRVTSSPTQKAVPA